MVEKKRTFPIVIVLILLVLSGCSPSAKSDDAIELTISAASSMAESLVELKDIFEKENPSIQISYNFGGSGALRKQIEQGAPIDLFFSASKKDYERLVELSMVKEGTEIFGNKLVLIKPKDSKLRSLDDLLQGERRIAIGTPVAVPAGTYAKEVLKNLGIWDKLSNQNRLVFTKDVAQVLTLVSQEAVDMGIVYSSDILNSENVVMAEEFDSNLVSPIKYFAAIINSDNVNEEKENARQTFYRFVLDKKSEGSIQAKWVSNREVGEYMQWSWHPVQLSLYVATIATVFTFLLAIIAAYWMARRNRKGKAFMETLFFLPLVLPPTVIGFFLIILFGRNSWIGQVIEKVIGHSILFTPTAAIVAAIVVAFPLMYQSIKTGFLSVDSNIIGAARVDGATEWIILFKIIIPLSIRSILTGIVLGFTRGFGEFGATLMFAGNIPGKTQTIPTAIYLAIETGATNIAWYYVIISISFSFLLLFVINRVGGK